MNRVMNVADALLLASVAPAQRRLRVTVFPEPSWPMTALVSTGVVSFFLAYFGVLLLFFMVRGPPAESIAFFVALPPA